jgi:glucose-1-phosphate adenylyltransferase
MNRQVLAMVLVGGRGTRLGAITRHTAKPAVPFAGKYKLIDFTLSNLSHAGIDTVGIITQYEPHELMNYIGHGSTWDLDVNEGGISFLTPYTTQDGDLWQRGTAHAIVQHFRFIDLHHPDYVLVLSGDHVYKMNYAEMIAEHIANDADVTIGAFQVNKHPERYGILHARSDNVVTAFQEKPDHAASSLASMGIYVFKREILRELLEDSPETHPDFGHDIIPYALTRQKKVFVHRFKGYFRDVGTIESLYEANMELIDQPQLLKLYEYVDLPVFTKSTNLPPHHIGRQCIVRDSLISDGCLINGDIHHSVLSSSIHVQDGCLIRDSILFPGVIVGKGSSLRNVIVLQHTRIPAFTRLEFDEVTVIGDEDIETKGERYE